MPLSGHHWPTKQLGRRGASLLVWGLTWFLAGLPLIFLSPPGALHVVLLKVWAAAFVAAGAIALVTSFRHSPRADRWGFVALSLVGSAWVVYCVVFGFSELLVEGSVPAAIEFFTTAVTDALLVVKINIDAGWPEPVTPLKPVEVVLDLPTEEEEGDE